ncbi:MAG TPA: hypothetical protein VG164_01990, partial [Trebonia sp.]|nr:hypothetical protein [Trebonia sp.]
MSTATQTHEPATPPAAHDTWPGLLRAEWTKIRSVRSTVWSLVAFMVVAIGFSLIIALVLNTDWNKTGGDAHTRLHTDPTSVMYGAGLGLGQLA